MEVKKRRNNSDDDEELQEGNDVVDFVASPEPPVEIQDELEVSDAGDEEERRCAALISACQNNMTEVVQELLGTEVNLTWCNHNQQTALHLSPPELQVKMVQWMSRAHLAPQVQLLQVAWQGDSASVRHLLTQTERVDVNLPNDGGVTAVMLAVRDIDLFEGLTEWLPWEHRPVEVVKSLLDSSADLRVRDHRGCSALHYAESICSHQREKIVWILTEALGHTRTQIYPDPTSYLFQELASELGNLDTERADSQQTSVKHSDLSYGHTPVTRQSSQVPSLFDHKDVFNQDERTQTIFDSTMETLKDHGRANQDVIKGSSKGLCLPSLSNNNKQVDTVLSSVFLNSRTFCQPVPPRQRQRTRSVVEASPPSHSLLSVAESGPLSQSAPSIMEPLLFSSSMMQARAHIQNRLGSQNVLHEHKDPLAALRSRTPKLLAPLDGRPKCSKALPMLQQHIPLKPISSRTQLRDRLSWVSPCNNPPIEKAGSEENGSISLENDDDKREFQETSHKDKTLMFSGGGFWQHSNDLISSNEDLLGEEMQNLKVQPRNSLVPLVNRSIHNEDRDHYFQTEKLKNLQCEANNGNHTKETVKTESSDIFNNVQKGDILISENNQTHIMSAFREDQRNIDSMTKFKTEKSHTVDVHNYLDDEMKCSKNDQKEQLIESTRNVSCDNKISTTDAKLNTGITEGNTRFFTVNPKKTFKSLKSVRNKDKIISINGQLRTNIQINTSFKMLGHKHPNKSKLKYHDVSTDVKDKLRLSPDMTVSKDKLKIKSASEAGFNIATPIPYKLSQRNTTHHHALSVRELKSAQQLRKPHLGGKKPRSKSAVDLITYKDLFHQLQNDEKGPAIYKMFAGPIFENLQISSSCEKLDEKQLSCPYAATRKTKQGHKVKPRSLKILQKLKRSSGESTMLAKRKAKPMTPRVKSHPAVLTKKTICNTGSSAKLQVEPPAAKDTDGSLKKVRDESEDHSLSTMKEDDSKYGSDTLKQEETFTTSTSSIYVIDYTFMQNHKTVNTSTQNSPQLVSEESLLPSFQQPKINTWTSQSSSRHTTMSPVYQKFLDEVGNGPLTDDLLQCLAEELISLDERDVSVGSENPQQKKTEFNQEEKLEYLTRKSPVIAPTESEAVPGSELSVDTITWTKGEVLGKGAYGTVYCGLTNQGQLIAVKQVNLDSSDPDAANKEYSRLQGEVELLKTLRHINVVGFLGTSLHQHVVSIFMEYIPGGSIASILHRFGPLPERVLALYTHQILDGVAHLHMNRVIHRDIKGNNVMLMPTGVIKLIDFGCARRLSCLNSTAGNSELLKSVHGTPYWMAPEIINESGYGRKSDIWSVGCTVFEMATGKPPLSHMDKMAALFYIGTRKGPMPILPDGFSKNAKNFVKVCLTSDQKLRPSADQLLKHSFIPQKEKNMKS